MRSFLTAALLSTALVQSAIAQTAISLPVDNSILSQTNSAPDPNTQQNITITNPDVQNPIVQAVAQPTSSSVSTSMNVSTVTPACTLSNCSQTVLGYVLQTAISLANKK